MLRAALRSSAKKSDSATRNANVGSVGASLASVVSPGGGANAAMMSAELWAISRTPPTAARRTLGYRELGANEVSAHDSAPSTEATTEARRRIAALSEAAAAAVEDGLRRLAAARGAREGGDGDDGRNARTEGNEGSTARELTSVLDGAASGAESSRGERARRGRGRRGGRDDKGGRERLRLLGGIARKRPVRPRGRRTRRTGATLNSSGPPRTPRRSTRRGRLPKGRRLPSARCWSRSAWRGKR